MTVKSTNILIIGGQGQLGTKLTEKLSHTNAGLLQSWGRNDCDLSNLERTKEQLESLKPDLVINAAAYTKVDLAETERESASTINAEAVKHLAETCAKLGSRLIHFSTDYVFSGENHVFQKTTDATDPVNWYGASKLAGERALTSIEGLNWVCFRTAWVYSNHGQNFLNTMLRLMIAGKPIRVVTDQIGSPTSTDSLTKAVIASIERPSIRGIQHWTDHGVASWYDFAVQIQREALRQGILTNPVEISPISTDEFPTKAKRPRISLLCKKETEKSLNLRPIHWSESLQQVIKERIESSHQEKQKNP